MFICRSCGGEVNGEVGFCDGRPYHLSCMPEPNSTRWYFIPAVIYTPADLKVLSKKRNIQLVLPTFAPLRLFVAPSISTPYLSMGFKAILGLRTDKVQDIFVLTILVIPPRSDNTDYRHKLVITKRELTATKIWTAGEYNVYLMPVSQPHIDINRLLGELKSVLEGLQFSKPKSFTEALEV